MAEEMKRDPFPIFSVNGRFLLYDVEVVAHVRRTHNLCGVLIGNIIQSTQQNVFNGLPVQLLPEEARLLVVQDHAYIVDDVLAHQEQIMALTAAERRQYRETLDSKGMAVAVAVKNAIDQRKAKFAHKHGPEKPSKKLMTEVESTSSQGDLLFDSPPPEKKKDEEKAVQPYNVTPTTSYPPLDSTRYKDFNITPAATASYELFAHLHSKGYFLSPGLRFGCQFVAYPGDPLRYHSHFLVVGKKWDEPFDLMNIVSGGRLGTGVKKAYMLGGVEQEIDEAGKVKQGAVKTYCFEWAAM